MTGPGWTAMHLARFSRAEHRLAARGVRDIPHVRCQCFENGAEMIYL